MYAACFILTMLPPILILCVGIIWKVSPPKMDSKGLAYRTALSTRSEETWSFAHRHCSKLWIRLAGQMVFFCLSAFLVDLLLKNGFDEHGNKLI